MSLINTVNFLPATFRTATNQRFLGATMDQLFDPVANVPVNGYIGRKFAPTYKLGDNYIPEATAIRQNYQLEPGVTVKDADNNVVFNASYQDFLNSIATQNGLTNNHQRLTESESYSFDGHFDYDKFVNYYNYYWLPDGPAAVSVYANQVPYQANYTVTRNTNVGGYIFGGLGTIPDVDITLARGGVYTFTVNQPGAQFWIQTAPGVSGTDPNVPNIGTRNIYGVTNNGTDSGVVQFKVPQKNAQDFYTGMKSAASVQAMATFSYTKIQNRLLNEFLIEFPEGIDGITNLTNTTTFIFNNGDADDALWTAAGIPQVPTVVTPELRVATWGITLTNGLSEDSRIIVQPKVLVQPQQKVFITSGQNYASSQYWVNQNYQWVIVPPITAVADYLYYQDSVNPNFVGRIKLVDNSSSTIDVATDIIGKKGYTSPNGVIFTNGLKIQFDSYVTPSAYTSAEFYVDGVGSGIKLMPVAQAIVPEAFGANIATTQDYITINRGSQDLNPWSRSNRWFHKDVILATAKYNNATADYGPNLPARRPIVEFESDLLLFQYGKQAKNNVDLIFGVNPNDPVSDAFATIEGSTSYTTTDGVVLEPGMRILFAKDYDTSITNKVWQVTMPVISTGVYINLIETADDPVVAGQHVLITNGAHQGNVYYFDGTHWKLSQAKTAVNQAPLFDLVDANGYSFGDTTVYPGSTFTGTKLFGYPDNSTGKNDTVLGFPLTYQTFNNIGDIVFTNYYDSGTTVTPASFTYTANQTTNTVNFNSGFLSKTQTLTTSTLLNNWVKTVEPTEQFQIITKFFDGNTIDLNGTATAFVQIDVLPTEQQTVPHLKVFLNNSLLTFNTDYVIATVGIYYVVALTTLPAVGDKIDVEIYSDAVSQLGYYQIPANLNYNPLNENFATITLGQLRNHYSKLIENTSVSSIPLQDSYLKAQGGILYHHSSPLIYAMTFLTSQELNFANGLQLARREYTKFKNRFLSLCSTLTNIDYANPMTGVDTILQNINAIKNNSFPWYYSDMVPQGSSYNTITYSVINAHQTNYEISSIFDHTQLSNRAVLIWLNGTQLTLGTDYTFSTLSPAVIFSKKFAVGDTIVIRDYYNTDGNYIPETPSKLGLYPKYTPALYLDNTYQTPINVIRGHDGSITPAFGDFRDNYLLELERRIYNNIKADYNKNEINIYDVVPGRFRNTGYLLAEFNSVLAQGFLSWAGANNINYTANEQYNANNPWTWNYSKLPDVIDGSPLQGSWRAINRYWFDTRTPNLTPWEMLGFGSAPNWWQTRYGPAPYTGGNTVLWEDLEKGYVWNNGAPYIDKRFARPGLTKFIPVDSAGNLLPPTQIPVNKLYDSSNTGNDFVFGQQGPAESAWRRTSDYAFSLQLALALTIPAKYFSTQIDTSKFFVNPTTQQFSDSANRHITPALLAVNGSTNANGAINRTSGYLNWIADSIKNLGMDPATNINLYLANLSAQLSYKVAGFIDKNLITVSAEQSTPSSTNSSVIIPDANYNIFLNKSTPTGKTAYSAVIVTKTATGYAVSGYDIQNPFFTIIPSVANNKKTSITVNEITALIYQDSTNSPMQLPYGTEFSSIQQTVDFIVSYERFLVSQGFVFSLFNQDLQETQNWTLSVKELLFWAQQGWPSDSMIILNPVTSSVFYQNKNVVVDEISNVNYHGKVLDQNFVPVKSNRFNIVRIDNPTTNNVFTLSTLDGTTICFAEFYLTQFEHVVVFDNVSNFGDILYVPSLGSRQYRLKITGYKTGNWSGALSAPGYIYNDPIINVWQSGNDYKIGDLVAYNNFYYTATQNIPASITFDISKWTQIQKDAIKTGLLPNFNLNAGESERFYDVDQPPTDSTLQSYGAGLIGFRQRQYLTDLGVGLPTQTKFYQGFIKQKGSLNAITAFTNASFNNVTGNIDLYEEWALKVGTYGGVNNNSFKEFVLPQNVFNVGPIAFTSSDTYDTANVIVKLNGNAASSSSNVYNANNLYSSITTIYDNRDPAAVYEHDLPSTGYVNVNDIDYEIFDVNHITQSVDHVRVGNKIWVAKNAKGVWDVLRVNETNLTATSITYGLDSYAAVIFNRAHAFSTGDLFVLKYFNTNIDGIYKVVSAPTNLEVIISVTNPTAIQSLINNVTLFGTGTVYSITSVHFDTITDLTKQYPINGWIENDRAWINNDNYTNNWAVYTYNSPWLSNNVTHLTANSVTANAGFGSQLKVDLGLKHAYVASPGTGQVQVFANVNAFTPTVTINNSDVNFGSAIDVKSGTLAVASKANVYVYTDNGTVWASNIVLANVSNISSITLSNDASWIHVGDSSANVVESWYGNPATGYTWAHRITGTGSFGTTVTTTSNGLLVVGAPAADAGKSRNGNVYVYQVYGNLNLILQQTITSQHQNERAGFGTAVAVDVPATNLYIGAPHSTQSGIENGVVERYEYDIITDQYKFKSAIMHPKADIGFFGTSISLSPHAGFLAIGGQGSPSQELTTFDDNKLLIDSGTTIFIDNILNSGAVYVFEPFNDVYGFVQELQTQVHSSDLYGAAIDAHDDIIAVGAPGSNSKAGSVYLFNRNQHVRSWNPTRTQSAVVDINSISRTFLYNKSNNNILAALDFIDPAKGKILQAFDTDIDYKLTKDPAYYNQGSNTVHKDFHWGPAQVGKIWWNLDTVRYTAYEQDDLIYRMNQWAQTFVGSSIDVYEWIESSVLASQLPASEGTPLYPNDESYCTYGYIDTNGAVKLKYYFWVTNRLQVSNKKNNSVVSIAAGIENPRSQGIPFATVLRDDTIALYNVNNLITGQNTVIQLGSKSVDANIVHSEYALVQEGNPQSKIPLAILNKLIDSLAGIDAEGNTVPDPALPVSRRYGTSIRPRQTMIINRQLAFANYLSLVNKYLLSYPVVERKVLTTLNSEQQIPNPNSGEYNLTVNTYSELAYIQTTDNNGVLLAPFTTSGYKVLVLNDINHNNKWSIYEWSGTNWVFSSVQTYKTNLYWHYADWYAAGFNSSSMPDVTVADSLALGKLTLTSGNYIKVLNAGNNKFAIYHVNSSLGLDLVGVESGTVQISTATIPSLELRQILLAMQQDIFIEDLANELNTIFFTTIKYILSEQKNLDWVFKTSFLSVTQKIRKLEEFASYIPDNQNFYLDYINEVKPYRTTVREFIVDYQKQDSYGADITDFDLPPYWDATVLQYRSPTGLLNTDAGRLQSGVYSQWNNNYKYGVVDIIIENPGSGYLFPPQLIISGDGGTGANAIATVDANGGISSITVITPGTGYTSIPNIKFNGTGTGAVGRAVLRNVFTGSNNGHNVVRSVATTMKFDRITYAAATGERLLTNANYAANAFVFWSNVTSAQTISANTIINLNNQLYVLANTSAIDANLIFPLANAVSITSDAFSNANDRIVAYRGNITLGSVFNGIDYPGVIVDGNTYVGTAVDATLQSKYTDTLGVSPGDVIVDGGAYVDTFSSHAPEELIPGRMYDSLNMEVFDRNHLGYRNLQDMNANIAFYRIANAATTTLSANLYLTDTVISVTNAEVLSQPSRELAIPGIIFVNGEKITYWRNYSHEAPVAWTANLVIATDVVISYGGNTFLTTGNVYAQNFADIAANVTPVSPNSLGHIRRAVDGTAPSIVHVVGSRVVDSSMSELVPNSYATSSTLTNDTTYTTTDAVSLKLTLTGPVTANIGDVITQMVTSEVVASMQVLESVTNSIAIPVVFLSGTIYGSIGFDQSGFDQGGSEYYRIVANTAPTRREGDSALPIWTANTVSTVDTSIFYNGNVYTTTGNTYAQYFTSISSGNNPTWQPNTVITSQYIYYVEPNNDIQLGNTYVVKGNVYSTSFDNLISNGNVAFAFAGKTSVTLNKYLTAQYNGSNVLTDLTLQYGDQWWNQFTNQLYQWNGTAWVIYNPTDPGIGFDPSAESLAINGQPLVTAANASVYIVGQPSIIGNVGPNGQSTVSAGTKLITDQVWYSPGIGVASTGQGLISSTTPQAEFLIASRAYTP